MSGLSLFGSGLTITEAQGPTYYLGTWNASTNTPTLASSTAPAGPGGSYYIVSVAGTTDLNGITDWTVGDWVIWSGSVWQKLEGGMTSVTVGSTQIAGGTTGRVLYDNAGVLGEMTNTGTGTVNVLQTSPALITPALGIATGTSLALGGATIGTNALAVTGTQTITGGTVTASAPVLNATQTWNNAAVAFSGIFANFTNTASLSTSKPLQIQVGGSNVFYVDTSGSTVATGNIYAGGGNAFAWSGSSLITAPSDGIIRLSNAALTGFTRLQFGGTTSSFPAIKRNGAVMNFVLADDSAFATVATGTVVASIGSAFQWNAGSAILSPADGVIQISNGSASDFTRLIFGSTTASFPSIKRNGTALNFRLANDSADAPITAGAATFSGAVTVPGVTTAALTSTGTFTSGAGAQVGTLTNAPVAGNPTTWIKIVDNGVTRYIPAW